MQEVTYHEISQENCLFYMLVYSNVTSPSVSPISAPLSQWVLISEPQANYHTARKVFPDYHNMTTWWAKSGPPKSLHLRMSRHHMLERSSQYLSNLFTTEREQEWFPLTLFDVFEIMKCLLKNNYFLNTERLQWDCALTTMDHFV